MENIDKQIALLHQQKKQTFYSALLLEYTARVVSCLEIWLILNVLTTHVSFADCCLIAAFSSLLANLLFFLPMQLGGREGGFALAVRSLCRFDYPCTRNGLDCNRTCTNESRKF